MQKKAEERWGAGVVEQVSLDLKREFPDADGFSTSNLWYMKKWYLFYTDGDSEGKLQRAVGELQKVENQYVTKMHQVGAELSSEKIHQVGGEFPLPFALVPWRHYVEIITKCKSIDEALFYVGKTIEQGLSRNSLANCIKANLYEHQGKIVNNFTDHLPALQSRLVQEVLKENYDFGFATVEHEIYDEAELEEALTKNVTDLLLELGTGFAFLGGQKELVVGGRSRKIDLLFYHIRLRCYIVCELKAKPFEHYPYFGSYGSLFGLLPYLQIGGSMSLPKREREGNLTALPSTLTNVIGHYAHGCTEFIMSELISRTTILYT